MQLVQCLTVSCSEIWEGVVAPLTLHDVTNHSAVVDERSQSEALYQHILQVVGIQLWEARAHVITQLVDSVHRDDMDMPFNPLPTIRNS